MLTGQASEIRTRHPEATGSNRRRSLAFNDLSQVVPEVRGLLNCRRTVGQWTLAQICRHLADTVNASMDGFDMRRHRLKRRLCGKLLLRLTFRYGIPAGYTVDPALSPPEDADLDQALADLKRAIARYQTHQGRLHPHPLFGRLSRPMWDRLHCFHCGHHLSFAIPSEG